METQLVYELVGYAASVMVAVSLMMRSILRLRVVNLVGSAAFTAYGVLIGAPPVAAVNGFIVLINLWYLRAMLRREEYFDLLEVRPDSEYLRCFLDFHARDVARFFPGWAFRPAGQLVVFVLRDMVPAGVIVGRVREGGTLEVELDYVTPQYRDFKNGGYVYHSEREFFAARGIREIAARAGTAVHRRYLRRMGFAPADPRYPAGEHRLLVG